MEPKKSTRIWRKRKYEQWDKKLLNMALETKYGNSSISYLISLLSNQCESLAHTKNAPYVRKPCIGSSSCCSMVQKMGRCGNEASCQVNLYWY